MRRLKYIITKCPICGKESKTKYSMERESLYRIYGLRYGIDVVERHDTAVYFYIPCDEHKEEFEQRVKEYLARYEKAKAAFKRAVEKEIVKLRSKVIDAAIKELEQQINNLKPYEGLVFWVCEAGYDELDEVREVYAVVYKDSDGSVKVLRGYLNKPQRAYRRGGHFAWTHYACQDALIYMSKYPDIVWRGYIQGLQVSDAKDLEYILRAVFFWTHNNPRYTLVDFLRKQPRELYYEFPSIIAKYKGSADPRFWLIVEREGIEQKVKKRIVKRYGVDPSRRPHVKDVFGGKTF